MTLPQRLRQFRDDDQGAILVLWALALVVFMGLLALTFDIGRKASTQTELQSFADTVALAAAAELDGKSDSITRATLAANTLISDYQTYGAGSHILSGAKDFTLTFHTTTPDGHYSAAPASITTLPQRARYVTVTSGKRTVAPGFSAAFAALASSPTPNSDVAATAVAEFELQGCDVAPITVCLPTIDFTAEANIGKTLQLNASVGAGAMVPGGYALAETLASQLDGLSVCATLLGQALDACLLAARNTRPGCTQDDGFDLSADLSVANLDAALNVRFGAYTGITAGLSGNTNYSSAPNVLSGLLSTAGLCLPNGVLPTTSNVGLPVDDCFGASGCTVLGAGVWTKGRAAYVKAHYNGKDPFPAAKTRYEFYKAEVAAAASGGLLGGLLGTQKLCSPFASQDPTRRLMVVAAIDCTSASVTASASNVPVKEFFEVFTLGPAENGKLSVEITACLGGKCGKGETNTTVRDVVRLVQ